MMKISPISHPYYSNTQKTNKHTPFKRDITTEEHLNQVNNSPLKDEEKKVFLEAYNKSKDFIDELDADINVCYQKPKYKKSFFSNEYIFPEKLGFEIMAQNRSLDKIPMSVNVLEDIKDGNDADKLSDIIKLKVRDIVNYIKNSTTYCPSNNDDFYTDNTGKWDLTDAYIP